MTRMVNCAVLGKEAPGLDEQPYPGDIGKRVYDTVSAEAWSAWLQHLVIIVNELQINSSDPQSLEVIETHMLGYLFKEGDHSQVPDRFRPR